MLQWHHVIITQMYPKRTNEVSRARNISPANANVNANHKQNKIFGFATATASAKATLALPLPQTVKVSIKEILNLFHKFSDMSCR